MKHCLSCDFCSLENVQKNDGKIEGAYMCNHKECSDPVNGDKIFCGIARTREEFCGFKGKYFKAKEVPKQVPLLELVRS